MVNSIGSGGSRNNDNQNSPSYTIKSGDSLASVAQRNGVSLQDLLKANPQIKNPNLVYAGQSVNIPGGGGAKTGSLDGIKVSRSQAPSESPANTTARSANTAAINGNIPKTGNAFIDSVAKAAIQSQRQTGVPASVTIAQAALESGFGKSGLTQRANNYFGIKGSGPAGSIKLPTREVYGGRSVTVNANFRAYNNAAESFADHGRFFQENSRYSKALQHTDDAHRFAQEIQKAGYATDPNYAKSLNSLIDRYNLTRFDKIARGNSPIASDNTSSSSNNSSSPSSRPSSSRPSDNTDGIAASRRTSSSSSSDATHTVRSGDTMWAIARQNGVSLNSLIAANPQIKNPDLIFPGQKINIPGGGNGGGMDSIAGGRRGGGSSMMGGSSSVSDSAPSTDGVSGGRGTDAYNVARSVLNRNISDLKYNGELAKYLDKWPGNNVCCANFVSASLEKAGLIKHSEHNDSVKGLAANLRNDPHWSETSLKNAKPGDVVAFNVPGEGPMSHVVMFAGWKNGSPTFIGSNNVNRDGSQRITEGRMGYPVGAVFHYNG